MSTAGHLTDPSLFVERCLIGGAWQAASTGEVMAIDNPATGAIVGTVPKCGASETEAAIGEAEKALRSWRRKTPAERAILLERWYALMIEHREDLALIMTLEQGKPLSESRGEITYGASFMVPRSSNGSPRKRAVSMARRFPLHSQTHGSSSRSSPSVS
ncbi:hypothetical protein GCM10007874_52850 [Labrys miyagiensis]|uniref:Aldehyde dehydrogenase domain-containing protein n=1 Tax=Labrys miyagiensis TaxID=346912 RepID=A0ABQ6CR64_9HYPH|nr:hypothetical protein GCM10007874_52850 [Labrys miyagiensis]